MASGLESTAHCHSVPSNFIDQSSDVSSLVFLCRLIESDGTCHKTVRAPLLLANWKIAGCFCFCCSQALLVPLLLNGLIQLQEFCHCWLCFQSFLHLLQVLSVESISSNPLCLVTTDNCRLLFFSFSFCSALEHGATEVCDLKSIWCCFFINFLTNKLSLASSRCRSCFIQRQLLNTKIYLGGYSGAKRSFQLIRICARSFVSHSGCDTA